MFGLKRNFELEAKEKWIIQTKIGERNEIS